MKCVKSVVEFFGEKKNNKKKKKNSFYFCFYKFFFIFAKISIYKKLKCIEVLNWKIQLFSFFFFVKFILHFILNFLFCHSPSSFFSSFFLLLLIKQCLFLSAKNFLTNFTGQIAKRKKKKINVYCLLLAENPSNSSVILF